MRLPRGWIRTDDLQWRRDLNSTEFQLVEVRDYPDGYYVVEATISLDEYSEDDIYRYISGYYDSVSEIREQYGDEANGVIAECIFEQMGCEEMNNQIRLYDSEEEAERQAICLINVLT